MRAVLVAVLISLSPSALWAAPTWQVIFSEAGRRIEIDRTTLQREGESKVTAVSRVVLDKEISDARLGGAYKIIESTTRYDCVARNASTLKRIYQKNDGEALFEDEIKTSVMPVRVGTLDDKVLRELCRPGGPKGEAMEVAQKASDAAGDLRAANEALVQQALAKAAKPKSGATGSKPAPPRRAVAPLKEEHAHAEMHWAYEGEGGPPNWAKIDSANKLCASGHRQSPIDIRDGIRVDLEPIKFDYRPSHFRIVDNGHTVQVAVNNNRITLTGKTYELVQLHFHKPSEEKINGKPFDMVVHLVHKSADGKLAVVAVLLERGAENPTIQTLWNYMPLERNVTVAPPEASIDLSSFLPLAPNYYAYMGSLTTPPCSEDVLWLVLKQPVPVSTEQIDVFGRLYPNNARPTQPRFGRLIKEGR